MLLRLAIHNIVLIDRLELEFDSGLSVLTGETGAGKSILLDAFALALGARGDLSLVRHGEAQGQVSATFAVAPTHPAWATALDAGVSFDNEMILRRVQAADGRSRAYVNDVPVSVQTLREIGGALVEIHGQHADRALMDAAVHRMILDAFGDLQAPVAAVRDASRALKEIAADYTAQKERVERILKEADYLRHAAEELRQLNAEPGEEEALTARRQLMMHAEKLAADLNEAAEALGGPASVVPLLALTLRKLERRRETAPEILDPCIEALDTAVQSLNDAHDTVEAALGAMEFDAFELERTEERLFALRAAARKYNTTVDELDTVRQQFEADVRAVENGEEQLAALGRKRDEADAAYVARAAALSVGRHGAVAQLTDQVNSELPPLKLENARFQVDMTSDETARDAGGFERVEFWAQTNPGTRAGPLMKVASGGELSRFMLALKVVLADKGSAPTLVFDEIDAGVGGAVANAIGARLRRLSDKVQVICVTHAPQVAALADHHFLISKRPVADAGRMETLVHLLDGAGRRDEIARMLAGAHITEEARAAASRLMEGRPD
ncbi:MAG: DNA repair protein RecN [Methylobacteriaceae bacterium]|jgi:DNA repair protein RecN (Recombination protein N)|nr:DNA repair protein RecN [Methylobacteriaceae bacterium]